MPWAGLALAHGLNALLAVAAIVLLLRGIAGGFSVPLAPAPFLATVALLSIFAAAVRLVAASCSGGSLRRADPALRYVPALALPGALSALGVASPSALPIIAGAVLVLLEEAFCWWWLRGARPIAGRPQRAPAALSDVAQITPPTRAPDLPPHEDPNLRANSAETLSDNPEDVIQQVRRIEMPDGTLRWQGWCRTRFGPAARHAVEHLSFCPPFLHTPHVHCRPVSGPPVRLRVSRVLPHGASVELRLASASAEPTSVTFEFTAATGSN